MVKKYTDEYLIECIHKCYKRNGKVNGKIINSEKDLPCRKTYYKRFGSIVKAIEKAGYEIHHGQEKDMVEMECSDCGAVHELYPCRAKRISGDKLKNCKHCMDKKKEVECSVCNSLTQKYRYRVKDFNVKNYFCSQKCENEWRSNNFRGENHPNWNPNKKDYTYRNNWDQKREKRIKKDNGKCIVCDMSREEHYNEYGSDIEVHHKTRLGDYIERDDLDRSNAHNIDNLQTMCKSCHREVETDE